MLKNAFTAAAIAAAATGAAVTPAIASDASGGSYSQNVNVIPHPCIDVKRVNVLNLVPVDAITETNGIECDEIPHGKKIQGDDKAPLSDLIDVGAHQR